MSVATPRPTEPQTTARLGYSLGQTFAHAEPEPSPPALLAGPRNGPWVAAALPLSAFGLFTIYGPASEFGGSFGRVFWFVVASAVLAYCVRRAAQGGPAGGRALLIAGLVAGAAPALILGGARALAALIPVALAALVVHAALADSRRARRQRARATTDHERAIAAWRDAIAERESAPRFVALDVARPRIDVVGGTPTGWAALLTTFAGRELDGGRRVQVLDLTATNAAARLAVAAAERGLAVTTCVLPEQLAELEFAADLDADDVRHVVEHVLCTDAEPDDALLHTILDVLGERATLAGLAAGLQVVLGHDGGGLSAEERAALEHVGTDPGVRARALALHKELTAIADAGTRAAGGDDADLGVFALDGRGNEYDSAILRSFLVHATLRTHRGGTLVICGAERLPVHTLERLLQAAAAQRLGLLLLYADLTDEIAPLLGRGDAAIAFMRLAGAAAAEQAAERIGGGHRFVLSLLTDAVSESLPDAVGEAYSRTSTRRLPDGPGGDWGGATGWAAATPTGSRELLVGSHVLQHLPRTAAVVVDTDATGWRRVTLLDTNPALDPGE